MAINKKTNTNSYKRKVIPNQKCYFTQTGTTPDYKDILVLKRFVTDRGKLLSQKYTGLTAKNQRKLSTEVKKARYMGLLAYTDRHAI